MACFTSPPARCSATKAQRVPADKFISNGQLIPDELMVNILSDLLDSNPATRDGVIFDGFPRTIPQAVALNEMLAKRGAQVNAVVGLEVADDELIDRLIKRGKESGRSDDNLETIKKRLDVYHNQTSPLRDFYIGEGCYKAIEGVGSIDEIFGRIAAALDPLYNA